MRTGSQDPVPHMRAGPTGVSADSAEARAIASTRPTTTANIKPDHRGQEPLARRGSDRRQRLVVAGIELESSRHCLATSRPPSSVVIRAKMASAVAAGSVARNALARVTARVWNTIVSGSVGSAAGGISPSTAALNSSTRLESFSRTAAPPHPALGSPSFS